MRLLRLATLVALGATGLATLACRPAASLQASTTGARSTGADDAAAPDIRAIAREAYVYGVPMLAQYEALHALSIDTGTARYAGPFNHLGHAADVPGPPDPGDAAPDADMPASFAALNLRAEPVVISVPAVEPQRYMVLQVMDLYAYNVAYIGSRSTGNSGGHFLVAGPDWQGAMPAGIRQVIRIETRLARVVGYTQLLGAADLPRVRRIQASYAIQPLSRFLGTAAPAAPPPVDWPAPLGSAAMRTSPAFFAQLAFLLQFAPPPPGEGALRARLAQIGIVPGQPLAVATLPRATLQALQGGMADGQREIDQRRAALAGRSDTLFGSRDVLDNDYVARAAGSQSGLGTLSREEALSPRYDTDADGVSLDGSAQDYVVRFGKDALPPVHAFWSLSVYPLPGQAGVAEPIHRYQFDGSMLPQPRRDADGGLTLYLQHRTPGKDKQANWLPIPNGPFVAAMRYYWPAQALLDNHWTPPRVERASALHTTGALP